MRLLSLSAALALVTSLALRFGAVMSASPRPNPTRLDWAILGLIAAGVAVAVLGAAALGSSVEGND